jgi:hypothetical protein
MTNVAYNLSYLPLSESEFSELELIEQTQADGLHLVLRNARTSSILGSVHLTEAAGSAALAELSDAELAPAMFAVRFAVMPGPEARDVSSLLVYAALRHARMSGKQALIAPRAIGAPMARAPGFFVADVQEGAYHVFESLGDEAQEWVAKHLLTQEIEETVKARCREFFDNAFFRAVREGTITRQQYIRSVANNHQFVRWTTRLLGRIVGVTSDRVLRRSYIEHMGGEIDHELLLENDLEHLGADVEWVKHGMAPNIDIQQFMCVQESMSAFHQDPVLFLAVPFAIEGITAFMGQEFMVALKKCIASWGIDRPSAACTFLSSHIEYDGGDDGHWEGSRKMFQRFLEREHDVQRVLNIIHMVMNAVGRAYESYVTTPDLTI